jgi:WD40 repeat protein/tRNA A-37 threonylcarbamoyl transferase component Bud32
MIDEPHAKDESLPLPALERIDRVCLEFEAAWQAGEPPQIESVLGDTPEPERSALLRELLLLELDYRGRSDEQPTPDEYQARFPRDSRLVSGVFEQVSTGAAEGDTAPHRPASASRQQTLPAVFGDYELLEVLGEGGMGVVYRARQRSVARAVALKIVRPDRLTAALPERRQETMGRFQAEIQAAARLEHEHIVPVYEVGQVDGQPFFSMRYIEGRGLDSVLDEGPMEGREAAALLEKVARAVHYAHGQQVIHRDLKPRNILLDGQHRPYVADFGLAKSLEAAQELTQTGEVLGTPAYMSPEQARGSAHVGHATDVYSLGATLYELLTGRPPFRAATPAETQRQVIDNEPVPPRELNPAVPRDLETVCLKCLEKEAHNRYATAEALADELARYQAGRPIHARPITRLARVWRWCRRNPSEAGLTTAVFLLLIGMSVLASLGYLRMASLAAKERDNATAADVSRQNAVAAGKREIAARKEVERALYRSQIALADREWRANNVARAEEILDSCPTELRRWEWHYLKGLCHCEQLSIAIDPSDSGRDGPRVVYSPDGTRLACGGPDRATTIWDAHTGALVFTLEGSQGWPDFSPEGDRIVTGGEKITIWNARTGEAIRTLAESEAHCVLFSPDGARIASASSGTVTLRDLASGKKEGRPGTVTFRDPASGKEEGRLGFDGSVGSLAFSPDGKRLAVAIQRVTPYFPSESSEVRIVDAATRDEIVTIEDDSELTSVAFSPDGRQIATSHRRLFPSSGVDVKVWDGTTGRPVRSFSYDNGVDYPRRAFWAGDPVAFFLFRQTLAGANHVSFSGDSRFLACAGWDRSVKIWDLSTGRQWAVLRGQEGVGGSVAFSPDDKHVAASNSDGTIKIWKALPPDLPLVPALSCVANVALDAAPDRGCVAADTLPLSGERSAWGERIRLHDVKLNHTSFFAPGIHRVLAMSPDACWVATSESRDGHTLEGESITIREAATGRLLRRLAVDQSFQAGTRSVAFSPDSRRIAVATDSGSIQVWDVAAGKKTLAFRAHESSPTCITYSPDGQRMASGDGDGIVKVSDATTGKCLCEYAGHKGHVSALSFSPDGRRIASAGAEEPRGRGEARVWDSITGEEYFTLGGTTTGSLSLGWSQDGARLVSTDRNGARIWDSANGEEVLAIPCLGATDVVFADEGWKILMSHVDYQLLFHLRISLRQLDARPSTSEQRTARLFVDWLFDEHSDAKEVLERIVAYPRCSEAVREAALEAARSRLANPELVYWEGWQAVRAAGRHDDYYRAHLRRLESLCRLFPQRSDYFTTLGVAQYRLRLYDKALETLDAAERLLTEANEEPSAVFLAYLAMTNQQLGRPEEAQRRLDRLYGEWTPGEESEKLLRAAESEVPYPIKQELPLEGFTGHLRFLPDDTLLVGMCDGAILRYDAHLKKVLNRYSSSLAGAANLRVSADGKRLAVVRRSADGERRVELLEVPSGRSICTIGVDGFSVPDAAFAPDSERLAVLVSSEYDEDQEQWQNPPDGNLLVYSAEAGTLVSAHQTPRLSGHWQSLDWRGTLIAVAEGQDQGGRGVLLWDVEQRQKRHLLLHPEHRSGPLSTALSGDGGTAAVGYAPYDLGLWDASTGKLLQTLRGHTNWVVCLDFSPDGRRLVSGAGDSTVIVWDPKDGNLIYRFRVSADSPAKFQSYTYSVSFDSTGRRLACGMEGKLIVWKVRR